MLIDYELLIIKTVDDENRILTRCYYYGLAQGFILDRLCGNEWKAGFFADGVYFDTELMRRSGYDRDAAVSYLDAAFREFGG